MCLVNNKIVFIYNLLLSSVFHDSYAWIHLYLLPWSETSKKKILSINKQIKKTQTTIKFAELVSPVKRGVLIARQTFHVAF